MSNKILEDMVRVKQIKREIIKDFSPAKKQNSNINIKINTNPIADMHPVNEGTETINTTTDMPVNISPSSNRRISTYDDGTCDIEVEEKMQKGGSRYGLWFVALLSIIFLIFSVSFLFTKATITITPKTEELVLNQNLSAVKDMNATGLSFDLVALSGEEEKTIEAGQEEDVETKAKGTIVIYNNFSSNPQSLDVETRLLGSNDKIYKTDAKIVIPGKAKDGTPGSIEVGIHAGEVGEEYNSGPLDLKVFGFKGTPKYEKFYARSKGEITSGFKGRIRTVNPEAKNVAFNELKDTLEIKLLEKVTNQIPEGFVLFKDAVFLTVDEEVIDNSVSTSSVPVKVKGTLYGFLFDEKKLSAQIAAVATSDYDGSPISIPNMKDFIFSPPNTLSSSSSRETKN